MTRIGATIVRWIPSLPRLKPAVLMAIFVAAVSAGGVDSPPGKHAAATTAGLNRANPGPAGNAAAAAVPLSAAPSGPYESEPIHRSTAGGTSRGANSPALKNDTDSWGLSKVLAALAAVLILIFGIRWLMEKMTATAGGQKSTRAMQVIARSSVSPRQQLMLIQVGKRLVLVGNSGAGMNPLCQIDDPDEVASLLGQVRAERAVTPISSFKSFFGRANDGYEIAAPARPASVTRDVEPEDDDAREESKESMPALSIAADLLDRSETQDHVQLSGREPLMQSPQTFTEENTPGPPPDPAVAETSGELSALMAKVRRLSQGLQR